MWTCEQQSRAPHGLRSPGSPSSTEGDIARNRERLKWLQAVQVIQSVVTGAGKWDVEQQDMAWSSSSRICRRAQAPS